jgi:hypothetical protein
VYRRWARFDPQFVRQRRYHDRGGSTGVIGVAIWYALAILYFAAYGRETRVLPPDAVKHRKGAAPV